MSKLSKDTHVYIPCPACGKVERVKLKWAQDHKTLKCGACKDKVDLRANPARGFIARTGEALADYQSVLDTLHAEAEGAARAEPQHKRARGPAKHKSPQRRAAKKRPSSRSSASLAPLPPENRASDPV